MVLIGYLFLDSDAGSTTRARRMILGQHLQESGSSFTDRQPNIIYGYYIPGPLFWTTNIQKNKVQLPIKNRGHHLGSRYIKTRKKKKKHSFPSPHGSRFIMIHSSRMKFRDPRRSSNELLESRCGVSSQEEAKESCLKTSSKCLFFQKRNKIYICL